jgi:crotonobetainyl-CoA:carnitine CoA-transferase CaiB-like acyl-CoA transferase
MNATGGALRGIRVVDIGGSVATGYCGKLFADHGARVVDVEPPGGAATRQLAPFVPGAEAVEASALHRWLSTNKSSVVLDIDDPSDRAALNQLCTDADVVLTADARRAAAIETDSPQLVRVSITWFGLDGPYAERAGSDAVIQSLAGMVRGIGSPDAPPLLPTGYQAQVIGGLTAFIGALAQVLGREMGNAAGPVTLDTSIFEANLCFTEVGGVAGWNTDLVGKRLGVNRFPPTYPLGVFPCRDGWIGVTVLTPSQWHAFCALLGIDDVAHVPAYQTALGRLEAAATLEPLFTPRLREFGALDLFHRAQRARIPLALVPTMEQLFGIDQFVERGAFAPIQHADGARLDGPVVPFRLYATPAAANGRTPRLGEHTAEVLVR